VGNKRNNRCNGYNYCSRIRNDKYIFCESRGSEFEMDEKNLCDEIEL